MSSTNSTDDLISFNFANPETLEEARNHLKNAKIELDKHPTYYNGASVQHYQNIFDKLVKESRESFIVVEGGSNYHMLTPLEICVSALKELSIRSRELEENYGHYFGENTPFRYLKSLADNTLEQIGEKGGTSI